ncbi:MAG: shikimate dehydrogenase [Lachnospiraceae bacterium]
MSLPITGHTILTGLLGSPVAHSLSPIMHNKAFQQLDLDYIYLCFDVNSDGLESAVHGLRTMHARGFNLTMPNKNRMPALCDRLSPVAELVGAVNTVVNDEGILTGHNTDGIGYMSAIKDAGHDIIGKKMTLLGAGGAAASIFVQAALDGVSEISIFNAHGNSFSRAQAIISQLHQRTNCCIHLYDFEDASILQREIQDSAILTNGTPVGMFPDLDHCLIGDTSVLRPPLIVSDIIYHPRETKLLRLAKENGCQTINGLPMLLYQGAKAFQLWTHKEMSLSLIKEELFSYRFPRKL